MATAAARQAKYRDAYRRKVIDLETLAADMARTFIEIKEVPPTEPGKARFFIELTAPQSVREALERYCERQQIDLETYLHDVGTELIVTAARK